MYNTPPQEFATISQRILTCLVPIQFSGEPGIWFEYPGKKFLLSICRSEQPTTVWDSTPYYHWILSLYYTFTETGSRKYSRRAQRKGAYICEHSEILGREMDTNDHKWQSWSAVSFKGDHRVDYTFNYKTHEQFIVKLVYIDLWLAAEIPENIAEWEWMQYPE